MKRQNESLDFYYQENQDSEDLYLVPGREPPIEEDIQTIEPIRIGRVNLKRRTSIRKKTVQFSDQVHCLLFLKGKWVLQIVPLNNKNSR